MSAAPFFGSVSERDPLPVGPPCLALSGAHSQDTTIDSSTTLTPPALATHLIIQATVAAKNVRITLDGTTPTASLGFVIVAQDPPVRIPTNGKTIKVIAETAGAAVDYQWETVP